MKPSAYFSMCRWIYRQIFRSVLVYLLSKISKNINNRISILEKSVSCFQILSKKAVGGINFRRKSKKFVKVQYSTIPLNQKRSNIYNQSIENKVVTQKIYWWIKNAFFIDWQTLCNSAVTDYAYDFHAVSD